MERRINPHTVKVFFEILLSCSEADWIGCVNGVRAGTAFPEMEQAVLAILDMAEDKPPVRPEARPVKGTLIDALILAKFLEEAAANMRMLRALQGVQLIEFDPSITMVNFMRFALGHDALGPISEETEKKVKREAK